MKMHFPKAEPRILSYRHNKNFENVRFIGDLRSAVNAQNDTLKKDGLNASSLIFCEILHCVKSVRIGSYSGPYFPAFGLNNTEYGHFLRTAKQACN